jgi:aldose 1-epimerase
VPKPSEARLTISSGSSTCVIDARHGGSIASWHVDGQPMLRSAAGTATDARSMASFPLVPYSNRIADGRFSWDGKAHQLKPNWDGEPHAIHGIGMALPWSVEISEPDSVSLLLDYDGTGNWPFAFEAEQRFTVDEDVLTIELWVTNVEERPVPAAFGHHPYFDADGAVLRFAATDVWRNDERTLPAEAMAPKDTYDFTSGAAVAGRSVDNGYGGWDGRATILWADRELALDIEASPELPVAVLYCPDDGGYFCFEPVPHMTDAINRRGSIAPMPVIEPGETFEAVIRLTARPVR